MRKKKAQIRISQSAPGLSNERAQQLLDELVAEATKKHGNTRTWSKKAAPTKAQKEITAFREGFKRRLSLT